MTYMAPRDFATWRRAHGVRGGGAMGDVAAAGDPGALVAQVNRFNTQAPSGYQFVTEPFTAPVSVLGITLLPVSLPLATMALTIYQRRATDAYNQFHDAGSLQAIATANAGYADPVKFVTDHMAEVTQTLQAFADSLGIPPVPSEASTLDTGVSTGTLLLAGGILVAWWLMEPKR